MAYFSMMKDDSDGPDKGDMERMREFFGPTAVDDAIRQAMRMCWMCLPDDQRNIEEVERQLRRILDRCLANAKEDGEAFGMPESQ